MATETETAAIIGAGISGLTCARRLQDAGIDVIVFEKSRGVGGRMATRRSSDGFAFDHGAQYFTVRDARFEQSCQAWQRQGTVAPWEGLVVTLTGGKIEPKQKETQRYAGVPGINAVCKQLAAGIDIQFQTRIAAPRMQNGTWRLQDENGRDLGTFDYVLSSAPSPQTAELLFNAPEIQQAALCVQMSGCWAAMLVFAEPLELSFDGGFVHESLLSWIARNSSKPKRDQSRESWILHASAAWSDEHIEDDPEGVLSHMMDAFWQATRIKPQAAAYSIAHRWRYAIPTELLESPCTHVLLVAGCGAHCCVRRVSREGFEHLDEVEATLRPRLETLLAAVGSAARLE